MIDPNDLAHCQGAIRHGSRSFHAASKLLPASLREPALALYAFCRLADDEVDLHDGKARAVERLRESLELCFAGRPRNRPEDRAFAAVIADFDLPRVLPEALLEGLDWDAQGRRYATLPELRAYAARVASAVGAMMCVLMRVRDRHALARACDLGVAMQLTNIARDVGEDAREGRLYLPLNWLQEAGVDPDALLDRPELSEGLAEVIRRMLGEAGVLYGRAEAGIGTLPLACRPGIFAARFIYAGIGGRLERSGFDAIGHRARTTAGQKLGWLAFSALRAGGTVVTPRSPFLYAAPLAETAFLVEAAAGRPARDPSDVILGTLAGLKARDLEARHALIGARAGARSAA